MEAQLLKNRYMGCLFGLAAGDALGAPVEFLSWQEIKRAYGPAGIDKYEPWSGFPAGSYTDDTQLSLATAIGCIRAWTRGMERGIWHPASLVYAAYMEWLDTQSVPQQYRAPGSTCLDALRSGKIGTIAERINNSKGCGGVMRTAPAGLVFSPGDAFREGAAFAAITHGHTSGFLPAGFLAEMIAHLIRGKSLAQAIELSFLPLQEYEGSHETINCLHTALRLAGSSLPVERCIEEIGEGWVGEEALAIAVYCALKFGSDWLGGTLAAVNHSGDSDSTGTITGAILGTLLGFQAIPGQLTAQVENASCIENLALQLWEMFGAAVL
ncbi:MAG: ADP-ribosylglycohydrolase family protein [Syntrophomonas sp.]